MPVTVTTRQHVAVSTATHTISLQGIAGWIFWCTLAALILYIMAFATVGWSYFEGYRGSLWVGLWMTCSPTPNSKVEDWFKASQAMLTIGLILLIACGIASFIYVFVHSLSVRKSNLLIAFVVLTFIAVAFIIVGLTVFGTKQDGTLHWSYALAVIGCIFSFVAGILAIVQMKNSNVC